jgi:hypothetical protein
MNHTHVLPPRLSERARRFVASHGTWSTPTTIDVARQQVWLNSGIPAEQIDRVLAYQSRWGGLALPPGPCCDGGPIMLDADYPEQTEDDSTWYFEAGLTRTAVPYAFLVGPDDSLGIHYGRWVSLHSSIEGWVESLALTYELRAQAQQVTRISGEAVADLDLSGMTAVPEVAGIADTWWAGGDAMVSICTTEAEAFQRPSYQVAYVYSGISRNR